MPRARISYGQRVIIEDMRKNGYKAKDICEAIGISSYDYQRELILGFWWRNGCVLHNKRIWNEVGRFGTKRDSKGRTFDYKNIQLCYCYRGISIVILIKYCYFNMEETQTKRGSNEPLLPILGQ